MTIKQFNKKIQKINELINDLYDHKNSVIEALSEKIDAIEAKADERESGNYTDKEWERLGDLNDKITQVEELDIDFEIEEVEE